MESDRQDTNALGHASHWHRIGGPARPVCRVVGGGAAGSVGAESKGLARLTHPCAGSTHRHRAGRVAGGHHINPGSPHTTTTTTTYTHTYTYTSLSSSLTSSFQLVPRLEKLPTPFPTPVLAVHSHGPGIIVIAIVSFDLQSVIIFNL